MTQAMDEIKKQLMRSGVRFEIGGFRPSDNPFDSWFGRVNVCAQGEEWPESGGKPMHALCQINIRDLPLRPPRLEDIEFITVFIGPSELPLDMPNGEDWCLRAYKRLDAMVPLVQRNTNSHIKAFPMQAHVFHDDFPCWEDVPIPLPDDVADNYYDLFENICGFKLGGWPTLIQSGIFWAPWNSHPAAPDFVFQIDTTEKGNWMWGDNGVGYFGRGSIPGKEDEWALAWQCY
jgi:uncharacterized protein YwqG